VVYPISYFFSILIGLNYGIGNLKKYRRTVRKPVSDDVNPNIGSRSTNPRQTATAQHENQTTLKTTKRVTFQIPLQPA
jgi:hypothetical protein